MEVFAASIVMHKFLLRMHLDRNILVTINMTLEKRGQRLAIGPCSEMGMADVHLDRL
jgi:hypothetical protein